MNSKGPLKNFKPDPSKRTGSYQDSLIHVTKLGTVFTSVFFFGFALVYWLGEYPRFAVWVNLAAVLSSSMGYVIITRLEKHRIAAHLVIFAIYLSSAGVMAISGGIHSSSVICKFSCLLRLLLCPAYGLAYVGEWSV